MGINDYYTIDSMLFGVDYIDTFYHGHHHQQEYHELNNDRGLNNDTTTTATIDSSLASDTKIIITEEEDKNHKEYCYKSNYEKYKGMKRIVTSDPLSNNINSSWNNINNKAILEETSSTLSSTLPSLIIQTTINNPLEFNINQHALDHIGIALDCFSSSTTTTAATNENNTNATTKNDENNDNNNNNNTLILFGIECSQMIVRLQNTFIFPFYNKKNKFNYCYGYYEMLFNQFILDFEHTATTNNNPNTTTSLFQDCIFAIQSIYLHQYHGIVYFNDLIVLQYNHLNNDDDDKYKNENNDEQVISYDDNSHNDNISTTASMILNDLLSHDINHTTTTTIKRSLLQIDDNYNDDDDMIRINYAFQLRFVHNTANDNNNNDNDVDNADTTTITLKLASININAPYTMIGNITQTINDCIQSLYPYENTTATYDDDNITTTTNDYDDNISLSSFLSTATTKSNKSKQQQEQTQINSSSSNKNAIQFHLNINQNGNIKFYPNISITYPFFQITGTTYLPYNGIYTIQSMIHQFSFQIQSSLDDDITNQYYYYDNNEKKDSFKLWNLPLDMRMRIFLFLDDITSLEQAFGIIDSSMQCKKKKKKRNMKNKSVDGATDESSNATTTSTTSTFFAFSFAEYEIIFSTIWYYKW